MALRQIRPFNNSNEYVEKYIEPLDISTQIPWFKIMPQDLFSNYNNIFKSRDLLSCAQQLQEIYIWNYSSFSERHILAPIVEVINHETQPPSIVFPRFQPVAREGQIITIDEILDTYNYDDYMYHTFLNNVEDFCEAWALEVDDILDNYNNIGYHPVFGLRIIDYGLSSSIYNFYLNNNI